jgi:hypothetical protein
MSRLRRSARYLGFLAGALAMPAVAHETATPVTDRTAGSGSADYDEEGLLSALESSLVREGGGVLRPGTFEIEPEFSYFYDEPTTGRRRDAFGFAMTARLGLRGSMQAELRLPYVVDDRWSGVGHSSGIGDARLGLTKEVWRETETAPAVFAFAQWRTTTGDINRQPPTGFGQDAIEIGVTSTRRQDPIVLFGSVSYTINFGAAHLNSGAHYESANVFGLRLGTYLAATPDTSLSAAVRLNTNRADRFDGVPVESTNRLRGSLELAATTVIGRGRFLNVAADIGFTSAAPKLGLTVSLPFRF